LNATEDFKKQKIPLVLFNRKINSNDFYSVCCNNLEASKQIAEFLIEKGSTDMAYIAGNGNTSTSKEREQGFTTFLNSTSIPVNKYYSDYTYKGGFNTAKKIIELKALPSAFFVANDIMALGVLDALREYSIAVPTEVKVIGFDNIDMASWPAYKLTTWEQPISDMVNQTVKYILSEIDEYTGFVDNIEINGRFIERHTT